MTWTSDEGGRDVRTLDPTAPDWCHWCGRGDYGQAWHSDADGHKGEGPGARFDPTLRHRRKGGRKPTVSRWFKADTAELVSPEHEGWINLRDVEALAWMAREACRPEFEAPYRTPTVIDLLSGKPSCVNGREALTITGPDWKRRIAYHLRYAVLCRWASESSRKWREALGLAYGSAIVVPGATVKGEGASALESLIARSGRLAWSLNTFHPGAVAIHHIALRLGKSAWIELIYGYPGESSSWSVTLAKQEAAEPLAFTVRRAGAALGPLLDPDAEPPMVDTWAAHGGIPAKPAPRVDSAEESREAAQV